MMPSISASVASFATECFRSGGAEKLLAEVIGIIVREGRQYQIVGWDYTKNDTHSNAPKITA